MATCQRCGSDFDVADARRDFEAQFHGEVEYDDTYGDEVCASCAVPDAEGLIDQGRAIMMVNGDEDYDDDFVQQHL